MVPLRVDILKADDGDDDDKIHRLVNLVVREVSLVDRGANRSKWIIRKREDDMRKKGAEVFRSVDGSLSTHKDEDGDAGTQDDTPPVISKAIKESLSSGLSEGFEILTDITKAVKSATEKTDAEVPGSLVFAVSEMSNGVLDVIGGCEIEAIKSVVKSDDKESRARKLLWMVMDQINNGALMDADEKKFTDSVLGMLGKVVNKAELEDLEMTAEVKSALDDELTELGKSMGSLIKSIEDTEETEEGDPTIPEDIEKALIDVSSKVSELAKKYEPEDGTQPVDVSADILSLLDGVLAEIGDTEKVGKDAVKSLEKVREALGADPDPDSADDAGAADDPGDEDPGDDEEAKKRGAKLSRVRRDRFRAAMKLLVELFDEVIPETERGAWSAKTAKRTKINKSLDTKAQDLEKKVDDLQEKISAGEARLTKVRKDIAKEMRRVQPSNGANVDHLHSGDNEDDGETYWPRDLNEEDDD